MKTWLKNTFCQAAWAPATVFIFYAVAAEVFDAYLIFPWLDMPTHFFGGMAITYFFLAGTTHAQTLIGRIPRLVRLVLPLGLTAITAVIWELLEYLCDVIFSTKMNLGVADTLSVACLAVPSWLLVLRVRCG